MPDGLKPESQQRFQALANSNKEWEAKHQELSTKVETLSRQVEYVHQTFTENDIKQPQFEQAASFIGAVNRGDYEIAEQILMQQLEQLAIASGKPMPGVDALQQFPDLRAKVDEGKASESIALELARHRLGHQALQTRHQTEQRTQQEHQQTQQETQQGLAAVDKFCRAMQSSDLDYDAIEKRLLPQMQGLLEGVPPKLWEAKVKTAYQMIKETAGTFRQPAPAAASTILRPTGQGAPATAPKSMFEAMWNKSSQAA